MLPLPYDTFGFFALAAFVFAGRALLPRSGQRAPAAVDAGWVRAALAIFRGGVGDPAAWTRDEALEEMHQWGVREPRQLVVLMQRFVRGMHTVAFDQVRILWLAQVGLTAGLLDQTTATAYSVRAKQRLQAQYTGWNALIAAIDEGLAQWCGGRERIPRDEQAYRRASARFAQATILPHVPFSEPNALLPLGHTTRSRGSIAAPKSRHRD